MYIYEEHPDKLYNYLFNNVVEFIYFFIIIIIHYEHLTRLSYT